MIPTATALEEVTRLRQAPGRRVAGVWTPGETTEATLLASVQPLDLEDADFAGGSQLRDRVKAYVPFLEHVAGTADRLRWGDDVLLWGADVLTWGGDGGLRETSDAPLAAAFDDAAADRVRLADGTEYVVEESRAWGSHVEAVLLRET